MAVSDNIKTIGTLTLLKIVGTVLGLVYSVYQVRYFGTSREIEVFFAAQSVVYLITSLTQSGQLAEIFLPEYIKLKNTVNATAAHKAYSVVINRITSYIIVLLVLGYFLAPMLMNAFIPGFSENDRVLAVDIFRVFLPFILLTIQNAFVNTILNAEKVYGRTEIAGVINYLASLLILFFFFQKWGIWTLVVSLYVGIVMQSILAFRFVLKAKIRYYFIWQFGGFNHVRFFKTMFSTFSYVGATQCLNWVTTASVSFLPQGVFAIYNHVAKIVDKINGVLIQPMITVFFSNASDYIAQDNDKALSLQYYLNQKVGYLIGVYIFLMSIVSGEQLLSLMWGGKNITPDMFNIAYYFLVTLFFVFIANACSMINRKLVVALGKGGVLYRYWSLGMLISAASTYLLIKHWGVSGLIGSILISKGLYLFIPWVIRILIKQFSEGDFLIFFSKVSLAMLVTITIWFWGITKYSVFAGNDLTSAILNFLIYSSLFFLLTAMLNFKFLNDLIFKRIKSKW